MVMASYGFSRTTIYKCLGLAKGSGRGERALLSRKATARARTLTPGQERQEFRWINGKDPRQFGFHFDLWTRQIVSQLIKRKFAVKLVSRRSGSCWRTRQSVSAASAVNARGCFWFATYKGAMRAPLFVMMLKKLMKHRCFMALPLLSAAHGTGQTGVSVLSLLH